METHFSFELDFAKTYPDFIKNLSDVNDNLTSREIKICMLIRMNFDSHYIQNYLNISRSTFLNARSSIRKKLGLKREAKSYTYLSKILMKELLNSIHSKGGYVLNQIKIAFILSFLVLSPSRLLSQDNSGPVLSSFTQDINSVDITSGGVTLTIEITVTDASSIANVTSNPSLTFTPGTATITSGYENFTNWSVISTNSNLWSPSNISPSGWIDASDASSYNLSGSNLSSITDKSGNFNMTIDGTPHKKSNDY